ncbi:MAG: thiamine pyrophosphate-binding protein [Pirellulales bacterium]
MNAADLLVEELQARGVPFIATLNGHGLDPLLWACRRAGMRMIDVRNEQAAAYMAEVTGRLTRSVGVCAVSGAVAHANAMTGVLNAWFDGAPMLLLTGITPLGRLGFGDFQDFNPVPMATPFCKYARLLDAPERTAQIVHEAFAAATSGRPGPVHLSLPIDVMSADVEQADIAASPIRSGEVRLDGAATEESIRTITQWIQQAERPVLVAGSGLYYAHGERALKALTDRMEIPTVVPIWDRGCIHEPNPAFMGVVGAATGGATLLPDADLVILAGAEFDYRVGQLSPPVIHADAKIVRIHADAARLRRGLEAHVSVLASPATVLDQLAQACDAKRIAPKSNWLSEARQRREDYRAECLAVSQRLDGGMNSGDVVLAIREVLSDDTLLLVDGGNIGQWFHQLLTDRYPGHWVTCGASGVVGWGLPGALAAKTLHPERPVILLSGDGSFTFTVAELECAARQDLNVVAVVADDEQWGISVTGHNQRYGEPLYSRLGPTRLDQVAEGFGCRGVRIESLDQLVPELRTALTANQPTVIQVPIVPSSPNGT